VELPGIKFHVVQLELQRYVRIDERTDGRTYGRLWRGY